MKMIFIHWNIGQTHFVKKKIIVPNQSKTKIDKNLIVYKMPFLQNCKLATQW